jgi:hypothetical protein
MWKEEDVVKLKEGLLSLYLPRAPEEYLERPKEV